MKKQKEKIVRQRSLFFIQVPKVLQQIISSQMTPTIKKIIVPYYLVLIHNQVSYTVK